MEEINGVSFRDYACASANLAAGMTAEKVCEVLGLEIPVWEATIHGWNNKMAELSHEDMAFFGEVFTNPKQGRFANVEGSASGPEEVLAKYPEWSDCIKMGKYMEHASNVGVDIDFDKEFEISLTQYSQLAMHWSAYFKEKVMDIESSYDYDTGMSDEQKEGERVRDLHTELTDKWEAHYSEIYKDQSAGISDDIDF